MGKIEVHGEGGVRGRDVAGGERGKGNTGRWTGH